MLAEQRHRERRHQERRRRADRMDIGERQRGEGRDEEPHLHRQDEAAQELQPRMAASPGDPPARPPGKREGDGHEEQEARPDDERDRHHVAELLAQHVDAGEEADGGEHHEDPAARRGRLVARLGAHAPRPIAARTRSRWKV